MQRRFEQAGMTTVNSNVGSATSWGDEDFNVTDDAIVWARTLGPKAVPAYQGHIGANEKRHSKGHRAGVGTAGGGAYALLEGGASAHPGMARMTYMGVLAGRM